MTGSRLSQGVSIPPAARGSGVNLQGIFASFRKPDAGVRVRAIIVPHAGYVYSGHTVAAGFAAIPAEAVYDNIFLIGVSHRYAFEGAAVFSSGNLVTPLGTLKVNRRLVKSSGQPTGGSSKKMWLTVLSIRSVQLPFIQYHFTKPPAIVPILIGTRNTTVLKAIASGLQPWFNDCTFL